MPRYKQRIKPGPKLSHDPHDKVMAALSWWKARNKSGPDYVKAPHYFDAILTWHEGLSLGNEERCAIHEVYVRCRSGASRFRWGQRP